MNTHIDTKTIEKCMAASFANTPFPITVGWLKDAGVTSYTADLVALRKTYYSGGSQSHDEAMPLTEAPAIAPAFDAKAVEATVKAIARKEIGYADFLRKIMAAGCSHYEVFFDGRKAMYFGRDGAFYTEPFPPKVN